MEEIIAYFYRSIEWLSLPLYGTFFVLKSVIRFTTVVSYINIAIQVEILRGESVPNNTAYAHTHTHTSPPLSSLSCATLVVVALRSLEWVYMALARISILVFVRHSNGMDGILLCTLNLLHGNYRLLRDTHTFKALQTIIAALAGQRATRAFRIQRMLDHVAYAHCLHSV